MGIVRYTLVCDGPTDANLAPILKWLLQQHILPAVLIEGEMAKSRNLHPKPQTLADKIKSALIDYPCELLFVHRDAEKQAPSLRHAEIRDAVEAVAKERNPILAIAVVPVRMLEAWLLIDESAIRSAAGNPNGKQSLDIPALKRLEDLPYPKENLRAALRTASGLQGRRLKKFNVSRAFWRITDYLEDYSLLRQLPAFCQLEESVKQLSQNNLKPGFYGQPK